MHIHILGIGGTFMGGVALLARALGYEVSGSDAGLYPPMSTMLQEAGIRVAQGYEPAHLEPAPDCVVVGNALSRGNPAVEHMLDQGLVYTSGPAFLAEHVLRDRWVIAVAGTHGKTTTAAMLAWILERAGCSPGFLIGGVPKNFGISARAGDGPLFVVEADEYDTAFFDKRSKFVHYRPRTLLVNNLEYDHADIFPDLESIKRQFHHLVRTVPSSGRIIVPDDDVPMADVLAMGCWTPVETFGLDGAAPARWRAGNLAADGSSFDVFSGGEQVATTEWGLVGAHNVRNALGAIAAASHAGVSARDSGSALHTFENVRRRLELRGDADGTRVFDDFAHHPTAIAATLEAMRRAGASCGSGRLVAVVEPRSNSMRMGVHRHSLGSALAPADRVLILEPPELPRAMDEIFGTLGPHAAVFQSVEAIVQEIVADARPGDDIVIMSNGSFGGIHERLLQALRRRSRTASGTPVAGTSGKS